MVKSIKIFNPKDYPFGQLSINNIDNLYIDGKNYKSVINYIYSELVDVPINKNIIQRTTPKKVLETFESIREQEIFSLYKNATTIAYSAKLQLNSDMLNTLLETTDSEIRYISDNSFLGTDQDGNGENYIGKLLMQLRRQLQMNYKKQKIEKRKQNREHAVYEAYVAELLLNEELSSGNDLTEYLGKTPSTIIDMIGRGQAMKKAPPKSLIIDEFNKKNNGLLKPYLILAIDAPESLVFNIRKEKLGKFQKQMINKRNETVLIMYSEYLLSKNYPKVNLDQYQEAVEEQLNKLGITNRIEVAERVYLLYEQGMFSERLSKNIDTKLENISIPTDEEVFEAEAYKLELNTNENDQDIPYQKSNGTPVFIYENLAENEEKYKVFSTLDETNIINIDNLLYPSIQYYLLVYLYKNLVKDVKLKDAYLLIINDPNAKLGLNRFKKPDIVLNNFISTLQNFLLEQTEKFTKKALDVKFSKRNMQDLLLATGDDAIIYNDNNNFVLGVKDTEKGKGMNVVGKYMSEIRSKIKVERESEKEQIIDTKDINELLKNDVIIYSWIKMRVEDTCKVLMTIKNYVFSKTGENLKITPEFVKSVLDNIYQPCSELYSRASNITDEPPLWFKKLVVSNTSFAETTKNIPDFIPSLEYEEEKPGYQYVPLGPDGPGYMLIEESLVVKKDKILVDNKIIELLWQRMVVMLVYLVDYIKINNIYNLRRVLVQIERLVSSPKKNCPKIIKNKIDNCILSAILNILNGLVMFNKQFSSKQMLDKLDIEIAVSIILNKDMKEQLLPLKEILDEEEMSDEEEMEEEEMSDEEENQEEEYMEEEQEEIDEEEEDQEEEYIGYEDIVDEDFEDLYSVKLNNIVLDQILDEIEEISDVEEFKTYLFAAIELVKTYKMSKVIKNNRINFFSSQL